MNKQARIEKQRYWGVRIGLVGVAMLLSMVVAYFFFTSIHTTRRQYTLAALSLGVERGAPHNNTSPHSLPVGTYPAVVIGGGVGGLTSALYLSMASIPTLLVEGPLAGGLLTQSLSVRNWPGEIDAPGEAITGKIKAQVIRAGAEVVQEEVLSVDFSTWPYRLTLGVVGDSDTKRVINALSVIVATGAASNYLGVPGEQEYWGRGVTNCAVCEGSLYKGKRVCVVGGGESAMEEAAYLADIAETVTIFVRGDSLKARFDRVDDVLNRKNVSVQYGREVAAIQGNGKGVTHVVLRNTKTNEKTTAEMEGVFLAIGHTPNVKLFDGALALTDAGYIRLVKGQETSVPGIFALGDVVDPLYKQAVTAAGDGCRAALDAHAFILSTGYVSSRGVASTGDVSKEVVKGTSASGEPVVDISTTPGGEAVRAGVVGEAVDATKVASASKTEDKTHASLEEKKIAAATEKASDNSLVSGVEVGISQTEKVARGGESQKSEGVGVRQTSLEKKEGPVPGGVVPVTSVSEYETLVEKSELPVLVDFYAEWCGPCKAMAPTITRLASEFAGKIRVVKVDIDHLPTIAARAGVRGVPTFSFVKKGVEVASEVGGMRYAYLKKKIEDVIA